MNVLLLSTHLNIGGIGLYIVRLARHLKKRGHNIIVASSGGTMVSELAKEDILHITLNIKTKSELSPKLIFALPGLLSLVKDNQIQIIHAHTRVTQVLACAASRLAGIPYIATCHGFFKLRLGRRLFGCWGDKTIAISDAVRRHLIDDFKVDEGDVALIYNGIDIKRFREKFTSDQRDLLKSSLKVEDGMIIGAVGRLSPVKGYRYLIEAFKRLVDECKEPLRLLIVGDGPQKRELKDITKRLNMESCVKFAEPQLNTPQLFSIMDIFVSSSVQEGLGLSLAEALAAGKAAVASNVGGVSSLIKDNHTGLLVSPRDSEALAGGISVLLNDPSLRKRLGANGQRFVESDFNINVMADKVEGVYKGLVDKRDAAKRILIVNVNWLGDVLFTTAFIKAVRRTFPTSFIACLVMPRCRELLENNPNINEVIIYDQDRIHKSLLGKIKIIKGLRKRKFDTAFILHRSFTRALMVYLSGIKNRIGYNTKKRSFLLTKSIEEDAPDLHKVEYFLNIARCCGIKTADKNYEFFVDESERGWAERFLKDRGIKREDKIVVLNPGGNWAPKRWPAENFAKLSEVFSRELNAKIIITGASKDLKLAQEILDSSGAKAVNACGETSIKRLAALMERADLVISSDSGPMHLALSVKTRVIALFGPTSDKITGPYGDGDYSVIKRDVGCEVPCYNFNCRDYRCMKAITVDDVFKRAKEMLLSRDEDR